MEKPEPVRPVDPVDTELEAEAEAAMARQARERARMSAREFVSERDALEDAWSGSGERDGRDEGW
jgi:hypothetical protein